MRYLPACLEHNGPVYYPKHRNIMHSSSTFHNVNRPDAPIPQETGIQRVHHKRSILEA